MKQVEIFFSILFMALIFAPAVAAWLLHGGGEEKLPATGALIIQFPSENMADDFASHEETDAA
jgi:hypothetical protein